MSMWNLCLEARRLVRICRVLLLCGCSAAIVFLNVAACAQSAEKSFAVSLDKSTSSVAISSISGTVLDAEGSIIEGARVQLSKEGFPEFVRQITSDATGKFTFVGLESGRYVVEASGEGMTTFVSNPIELGSRPQAILQNVVLRVATATTSIIVMDERAASIEQVHIAEQQRALKVFPNFYSSFDWNAPPMLSKQKYHLAVRTLIDPVMFLTTGAVAGAEQYRNTFPSFGSGPEGYVKRYGAAYATHASSELLTRAIFPSLFHTDPRYFIMGNGSKKERVVHALTSTFVTRGDSGSPVINFPEILGGFSSAALSNAYYPASERGVNLVLVNGFGNLGGNFLDNLVREFVLNHLTAHGKGDHN